jgi:hypothetical protein
VQWIAWPKTLLDFVWLTRRPVWAMLKLQRLLLGTAACCLAIGLPSWAGFVFFSNLTTALLASLHLSTGYHMFDPGCEDTKRRGGDERSLFASTPLRRKPGSYLRYPSQRRA